MEVAVVSIAVPQGGKYEERFTFYEDEAKTTPKDLGVKDWSGKIVIRDKAKKFPAVESATVDTSEADTGVLTVTVPSSVTSALRTLNHEEDALVPMPNYVYVVSAESGDETVWLMRGELSVIPDPAR